MRDHTVYMRGWRDQNRDRINAQSRAKRSEQLRPDDVTASSARFWAKVDKIIDRCNPKGGCWLWTGQLTHQGYGRFSIKARHIPAHRFALLLRGDLIPDDLTVDHLCRVRSCVRPTHLEVVSVRENVLRGVGLTALNARRTHCPHGHAYNSTNTMRDRRGRRSCRTCAVAATRAWRERQAVP